MNISDGSALLAALCLWREARNQSPQAQTGVWWVIQNRAKVKSIADVIVQPFQFSSFNANDPNYQAWPCSQSDAWIFHQCLSIVRGFSDDPTDGATFYFSEPLVSPPAAWGNVQVTAKIDGLTFCKSS
jgi:spore germination cell wall hydrolase CwlJ-like protein